MTNLFWIVLYTIITIPFSLIPAQHIETVITPVVGASLEIDPLDAHFEKLKSPVCFTQNGVRRFLQNTFSDEMYKDFLSHNFDHFIQFLSFAKEKNQDSIYTIATLRLFTNKCKQLSYINAKALNDVLRDLPDLLDYHFQPKQNSFMHDLQNSLKRILYQNFLAKFNIFKTEPEDFFEGITQEMVQTIEKNEFVTHALGKEHLKNYIVRFLEITIAKILWSPTDQKQVWQSVKTTAILCQQLYERGIISEDDLDDLYQSLIMRFSDFILLVGDVFDLDTLEEIRIDIIAHSIHLFTLNEQEELLKPRVKTLERALSIAEIKARAHAAPRLNEYTTTVKN